MSNNSSHIRIIVKAGELADDEAAQSALRAKIAGVIKAAASLAGRDDVDVTIEIEVLPD